MNQVKNHILTKKMLNSGPLSPFGLNMYNVSESFDPTTCSKCVRTYANSASGPSTSDVPGSTPAPIDVDFKSSIISKSSSVASLLTPYPFFLPLQYIVHSGSSSNLTLSFSTLFSHSRAIRTIPMLISFCNTCVCMASSTTNVGRVLGFSCNDKLTLPLRYPNRVPLTRVLETLPLSGRIPPGRDGSLQTGGMMGNDRKTDRKARNALPDLCFFL